jgi:proline iminopeptidase
MRTEYVNGTTIAYTDVGDGIPLVCLHGGMGLDARSLRVPGILDLAAHGIRLIIPDQRGHGASAAASDAGYTHATWATDVFELAQPLGLTRRALGERSEWNGFALLGHSYGGFIALEYAVRWPGTLTHLVLVGTSAGPVRAPARTFASDADLREHLRSIWPRFFSGADKHWDLFDAIRFSAGPYNAAFARELPAYDLRHAVRALDMPMLLAVGSDDAYLPHMEWIAKEAKHATLCVFDGVGHLPFVEAPDRFVHAVAAFVTGAPPR